MSLVVDLLHAGASYLRIHQKGFGAVGVSTKYGQRAFRRYPIFWGMKDVGGRSPNIVSRFIVLLIWVRIAKSGSNGHGTLVRAAHQT